jgi:Phage portal protein, SPP1 Gp6-like
MRLPSTDDIGQVIAEWGPVATTEWNRLAQFEAYFVGLHRPPYQPETATREFRELMHRSVTNLTRLIVNTMTQRLVVDGFKPSATSVEDAPQWEWWQANGLDARQKALYDEAAKAGYAGCMVLPGEKDGVSVPVMRPVSAREWWIGFEDFSDDWPFLALKNGDRKEDEPTTKDFEIWHVLDDYARYVVRVNGDKSVVVESETIHNLGTVPIVPFRNSWNLTRYPEGEIEPIVAIQDRLNQSVFDLLVAQTYSAAPQKWATGLVLPTDTDGKPLVDLRAFAKSLWATSDVDAKFGSLPEANLSNIVEAIEQALRVYGLTSQTPPHYLLGDLVNLSAEALLAADTTLAKKVQDRQVLFGEAWEQVFRLAGVAAGDESAANDTEAQVWWRDTEPRSIAQQVDALGKLTQMLDVPPEALWSKVPGATGGDLQLWRAERAKARLRALREGQQQPALGQRQQPALPPAPGNSVERTLAKAR